MEKKMTLREEVELREELPDGAPNNLRPWTPKIAEAIMGKVLMIRDLRVLQEKRPVDLEDVARRHLTVAEQWPFFEAHEAWQKGLRVWELREYKRFCKELGGTIDVVAWKILLNYKDDDNENKASGEEVK